MVLGTARRPDFSLIISLAVQLFIISVHTNLRNILLKFPRETPV
jgi:hypothetical protein